MALDFDVDDAPSFAELVRGARRDVMKGRAMAACWSELADQHAFFKDIAMEGHKRGEVLGAVLAALQGICAAVRRVEEAAAAATASPTTSASASQPQLPRAEPCVAGPITPRDEAQLLTGVAQSYMCLYATTPVPTRVQWLVALQPLLSASSATENSDCQHRDSAASCSAISGARSAAEEEMGGGARSSPPSAPSTLGRYLAKLRQRVQEVAGEVRDAEVEGEDGSFAEEELKELVRCCMAAGRRAARPSVLPAAEARQVREMVKVLQDYVGSATLEW